MSIAKMYKFSGGTDYLHTCAECSNCVKYAIGKRYVYKCLAYSGDMALANWKHSYIACKHFNQRPPMPPVAEMAIRTPRAVAETTEEQIPGQMCIGDYI